MMDELLAACGVIVSHEIVRQWALKFGRVFAKQIRRRLPVTGDKWQVPATQYRATQIEAIQVWAEVTGVATLV